VTEVDNFASDQLCAAQAFAHTMIVVDDEAGVSPKRDERVVALKTPTRNSVAGTDLSPGAARTKSHPLDSKLLMGKALELGLICSIVAPAKSDRIVDKVTKAARRADIVSLDWQIHGDDGTLTIAIIKRILAMDKKNGGRLRLIAIYTGVNDRAEILNKVMASIPASTKEKFQIEATESEIYSANGLRIVWLHKRSGVRLSSPLDKFDVDVERLPARLQKEFSYLSKGFLSNIALSTIASLRDATHHVLGIFHPHMDGAYFQHRATIEAPVDAEDYAVSIVLSELKKAIDDCEIARKMAGPRAIKNRLAVENPSQQNFTIHHKTRAGAAVTTQIPHDDLTLVICDGHKVDLSVEIGQKVLRKFLSTIFVESVDEARKHLLDFGSLTGLRKHPCSSGSETPPALSLGTIMQTPSHEYLLCLQASCDSVRVEKGQRFYFIPIHETSFENAQHIVPTTTKVSPDQYLKLMVPDKPYTFSRSLQFSAPCGESDQRVRAVKLARRSGQYFVGDDKIAYKWIADLKQRRALRIAQDTGHSLTRIGFDEFEPFRGS
jgi:hypothetical protein